MIYKCDLCGSLNKTEEDNFETENAVLMVEHLEGHIDALIENLMEKDKEIAELKKGNSVAKKYHKKEKVAKVNVIKRPEELTTPGYPKPITATATTKQNFPQRVQHNVPQSKRGGRTPFTEEIKQILMHYYQHETAQQLRQRILDQTGREVHISSIYNWMSKNRKATSTA